MRAMRLATFILVFLSLASWVDAQSLTELAKKEKERRKQNTSEGQKTDKSFTNVVTGAEEDEATQLNFETMEEYEKELDRLVYSLKDLCEEFKQLSIECTGWPRQSPSCNPYLSQYWKKFVRDSSYILKNYSPECKKARKEIYGRFASLRLHYDYLYREYKKLAAAEGKLDEIEPRIIPRPGTIIL